MNKFKKLKQSKFSYNEDSSDYISDAESSLPGKARLESDSIHESNSNSYMGHLAEDYSNDSFDRDREFTKMPKGGSQLNECLDYLHRMVIRKDKEGIFEFPVTDQIAPGYSTIIKNPMDLSTMKSKIEANEYTNVMEYRDDLILMCDNCMTYNKPDTIYYQFAKKMRDYGFKLLSREKLLTLRATTRHMRFLTEDELGFSLEAADIHYDTNALRKKHAENKLAVFKIDPTLGLQTQDLLPSDSRLMPPEGDPEPIGNEAQQERDAEAIHTQVKALAQLAAARLNAKNPHGKMGFLRRNSNGTTGYHILQTDAAEDSDEETDKKPQANTEKAVTIGNLMEGLQATSYSMSNFLEEKKDPSKPMHFVETGPFSNSAPTQDNAFRELSPEEVNALTSSYGDEVGAQFALSLIQFSSDAGAEFQKYVKTTLNELSCNEHEKYLKFVANKTRPVETEVSSANN